MFFASFKRIANSPLYQCVHYDNTRIIRLSQKQVTVVVVVVRKKCSKINSFFFWLAFFLCILRLRKRTYKKRDDVDDDYPRAALALRDTFLE